MIFFGQTVLIFMYRSRRLCSLGTVNDGAEEAAVGLTEDVRLGDVLD
jgi:hypothetical protein